MDDVKTGMGGATGNKVRIILNYFEFAPYGILFLCGSGSKFSAQSGIRVQLSWWTYLDLRDTQAVLEQKILKKNQMKTKFRPVLFNPSLYYGPPDPKGELPVHGAPIGFFRTILRIRISSAFDPDSG